MWVEPEDVTSRWVGPGAPSSTDPVLAVVIADAEDEILTAFPKIANRITAGEIRLTTVQRVVAAMVIRVYRNPENLSQFQQTVGPASQGKSYRGERATGLELTDAERARLSPSTRGKAFMVDLMPKRAEPNYSINGFGESPPAQVEP